MSVNQSVHFSDWVIGHSHLAMLGFATFAAAGGLIHAWQRIPWARYDAMLLNWSYWLLLAGVTLMVLDLTAAGLVEAHLWQSAAPWIESVRAAKPYWLIRAIMFVPITAGFLALLCGLLVGKRGGALPTIQGTIGLGPIKEIAPHTRGAGTRACWPVEAHGTGLIPGQGDPSVDARGQDTSVDTSLQRSQQS
jgi:heme/copper-type cytochrome/quinol oxidase subunit 1